MPPGRSAPPPASTTRSCSARSRSGSTYFARSCWNPSRTRTSSDAPSPRPSAPAGEGGLTLLEGAEAQRRPDLVQGDLAYRPQPVFAEDWPEGVAVDVGPVPLGVGDPEDRRGSELVLMSREDLLQRGGAVGEDQRDGRLPWPVHVADPRGQRLDEAALRGI